MHEFKTQAEQDVYDNACTQQRKMNYPNAASCASPSRVTARAFGTVSIDMPLEHAKSLLKQAEQSVRVSRALGQFTPDVAVLEDLLGALRREVG